MNASLAAKLVPLQDIDLKIHSIAKQLARNPEALERSERRLAKQREAVEEAGEKVKDAKLEAAREEGKIQSIDEEIARYDGQVRLVKKNDEYQILMKEISSKKADKSVVEDALLEIWSMVEHEEALKKECEAELAEGERDHVATQKRIEEELERGRRDLEAERTRRSELIPSLDEELVALYERTQKSKADGRGLSLLLAVASGTKEPDAFICGGCNMNITLQDANQVYVGREPILCRNCARLLYLSSA